LDRENQWEQELTFPVVWQQQWAILLRYAMFATPIAPLIDEAGVSSHDVAVGVNSIQDLMTCAVRSREEMLALV